MISREEVKALRRHFALGAEAEEETDITSVSRIGACEVVALCDFWLAHQSTPATPPPMPSVGDTATDDVSGPSGAGGSAGTDDAIPAPRADSAPALDALAAGAISVKDATLYLPSDARVAGPDSTTEEVQHAALLLIHEKDCAVHSPSLRPCSCGLETRLRARIEQLSRERDKAEGCFMNQVRIANDLGDALEQAEARAEAMGRVVDAAITWAYCPPHGAYQYSDDDQGDYSIEGTCEALSESVEKYTKVQRPEHRWTHAEMRAAIDAALAAERKEKR